MYQNMQSSHSEAELALIIERNNSKSGMNTHMKKNLTNFDLLEF